MFNRTKLRIVSYIVTGIAFTIFIIMFIFGVFLLLFVQDNINLDDFKTHTITIETLTFNEDYIYITSLESINFLLDGQNFLEVINHDIQSNLHIGDQVTIIVGKKGWGDSWDYPIVMLEKEGIVYLTYENGVSNLQAQVTILKPQFYKSLILALSVFMITFGVSLYFFLTRNKY